MTTQTLPDGRVFTLSHTAPHMRKDGRPSQIAVWVGVCQHPGCSAPFQITTSATATPETSKAFGAKHCNDHKLTRSECMRRARAARKPKNT